MLYTKVCTTLASLTASQRGSVLTINHGPGQILRFGKVRNVMDAHEEREGGRRHAGHLSSRRHGAFVSLGTGGGHDHIMVFSVSEKYILV